MPVFAEVLREQLRGDPGRPLLTFYDQRPVEQGGGERTELSVTTYANWVAKAASLLADEHGLERGDRLRVDLPTHWLAPVFVGAAWTVGLVVVDEHAPGEPDAVVCGPGTLPGWAPRAADLPVLACALLPLGVRFADPVPAGVHDVGVEVWGQPDAFVAADPPTGADDAVLVDGVPRTHDDLWAPGRGDPGRVLTTTAPASSDGLDVLAAALGGGGSLVLVAHPDPARLGAVAEAERAVRLGAPGAGRVPEAPA